MKKMNIFLKAALESADTVEVGDIHTATTLQPKPGTGECKEDDGIEVVAATGEEHPIAKHDEIDAVAESQETTLALEHLTNTMVRFNRHVTALEEISEQLDERVEAENPLDATATAMITTAVDSAGVGEPLAPTVALESYDFSAIAATESFSDTLKERAAKVAEAVSKLGKSLSTAISTRYKTIAAQLKLFPGDRLGNYKKRLSAVQEVAGQYFENGKVEKTLMAKFNTSSSTRSPLAAVTESLAEYDAVTNFLDNRLSASAAMVKRAWREGDLDKVPDAVNKLLADVAELSAKYSVNSKFAAFKIEIEKTKATPETVNKLDGVGYTRKENTFNFDSRLRIASIAEAEKLESMCDRITRAFVARNSDITASILYAPFKAYDSVSLGMYRSTARISKIDVKGSWTEVKLGAAVRYSLFRATQAARSIEMAACESVYRNCCAAADWVNASVAEGKRQMAAA